MSNIKKNSIRGKKCNVCEKRANFECESCKKIYYCSPTCQIDDWKNRNHEQICNEITKSINMNVATSSSTTQNVPKLKIIHISGIPGSGKQRFSATPSALFYCTTDFFF